MTLLYEKAKQVFQSLKLPFQLRGFLYLCDLEGQQFYYSPNTGKWRVKGQTTWRKSQTPQDFITKARLFSKSNSPSSPFLISHNSIKKPPQQLSLSQPQTKRKVKQLSPNPTTTIPNYQLRDYQIQFIQDIYHQWTNGRTKVLAQLPTGAGKTLCFAAIASEFACRGEKVIILAHREELVGQAAQKLRLVTQQDVGIIKAKYRPDYSKPVQVASVQSLVRRTTLIEKVGLIIIDEAHHSTANTYRQILDKYPDAYQLGVTATPIRLDGVGFRDLFDELVCGLTISELIKQKYLSPFRLYAAPRSMSTQGVRLAQGDYSVQGLEKANNIVQLSGQLIESYLQYAQGKRCLVFAINLKHSQMIAARYNQAGIPAFHLDGNTPDAQRRHVIEQFRQGKFLVLTNCQLFDEGLDIPGLEAVQIAKPTKSLTKWLQMVGRVLRPSPDKHHAIILDHTKNWAIHGLPTRQRHWSLDGVQEPKQVKAERNPSGLVTEEKLLIQETSTVLTEIDEAQFSPPDSPPKTHSQWEDIYQSLIYRQRVNHYQLGWIYYQLKELKPPLFLWQAYGQLRGYSPQWAVHQFRQQQGEPSSDLDYHFSLAELELVWQIVTETFSPLTRTLLQEHTRLMALTQHDAHLVVKSPPLLSVVRHKKAEIESAFGRVFEHPIYLHLTLFDAASPLPNVPKVIGRPFVDPFSAPDLDDF